MVKESDNEFSIKIIDFDWGVCGRNCSNHGLKYSNLNQDVYRSIINDGDSINKDNDKILLEHIDDLI